MVNAFIRTAVCIAELIGVATLQASPLCKVSLEQSQAVELFSFGGRHSKYKQRHNQGKRDIFGAGLPDGICSNQKSQFG
jgi:hypothetical protein